MALYPSPTLPFVILEDIGVTQPMDIGLITLFLLIASVCCLTLIMRNGQTMRGSKSLYVGSSVFSKLFIPTTRGGPSKNPSSFVWNTGVFGTRLSYLLLYRFCAPFSELLAFLPVWANFSKRNLRNMWRDRFPDTSRGGRRRKCCWCRLRRMSWP